LLQFSFVKSNLNQTMDIIPSLQILIQEFHIKLEEKLLLRLLSFGNIFIQPSNITIASQLTYTPLELEISSLSLRKIYFGFLILNPVKVLFFDV